MSAKVFVVIGLVQGVFFRDQTKVRADQLKITGWVKNTDDGAVEIHAEGSDASLKALEEWCHHGPPRAKVEKVDVEDAKEEMCENFSIIW